MEKIIIKPKFISGEVTAPPSKSCSHRALFAAALSGGRIVVKNLMFSNDITATINCIKSLGAEVSVCGSGAVINGGNVKSDICAAFNAGESGTTLRFIIPLAVMLGGSLTFDGEGRLPFRPIDEYFKLFDENGIKYMHGPDANLPLKVDGKFKNTDFGIRCDKSSQYASGLMMCGMVSPVTVNITSEISSKPYLDITADVLRDFGCDVEISGKTYKISRKSKPTDEFTVEGDWSQAAFYMCAAAINGCVTVKGVKIPSSQGDFKIIEILRNFGADVTCTKDSVTVKKSNLRGISFDAENIPDLVPVLAVLACFADGKTHIRNVSNLKFKESDRIAAIMQEIEALGGIIEFDGSNLTVTGVGVLNGGEVDSHNDHRIAMSMAAASVGCKSEVIISGYKSVNKSYPTFFEDWSNL